MGGKDGCSDGRRTEAESRQLKEETARAEGRILSRVLRGMAGSSGCLPVFCFWGLAPYRDNSQ